MRYILAVIVSCAIAAPVSAAAKSASGQSAARSSAAPAPKRDRAASHRQNKDLGGIHPLVGSGEY